MSHIDHRQFDSALDAAILPSLSKMLDLLLDSASLARPGYDARLYAEGLRETAQQLDALAVGLTS